MNENLFVNFKYFMRSSSEEKPLTNNIHRIGNCKEMEYKESS